MRVGHEQRQAEVAQYAFHGAFPIALVVAHLDQLAGERHRLFGKPDGPTQRRPQCHLRFRNVAASRLEAGDFLGECSVLALALAKGDTPLGDSVLQIGFQVVQALAPAGAPLLESGEARFIGGGCFIHCGQKRRVPLGPPLPAVAFRCVLPDVGGHLLQPVATVFGHGALERIHGCALAVALLSTPLLVRGESRLVLRQEMQAPPQQAEFELGEVGLERVTAVAQIIQLGGQLAVAVAVGHQRYEQLHLALGLEHRLVGTVQVVEVRDERTDARRDVKGFQHVAAHEVGEVAHRFHRHRLMEQFQRLFVVDAAAAPKPRAVLREAVLEFRAQAAQSLAQLCDVRTEAREVRGDRQLAFSANIEARGLALGILHPEHLGQRDGLVVARVVEHAEDHGIAVVIAQAHGFGAAGRFVALGLVMPEHLGPQRAFPAVGAGGLVVDDAMGGHQECGDRVHQRRFAGADVAGQQTVLAVEPQCPHATIEGPPVQHFQPLQAKAGQRVVGDEVQSQGLRPGHAALPCAPSGGCPSGVPIGNPAEAPSPALPTPAAICLR